MQIRLLLPLLFAVAGPLRSQEPAPGAKSTPPPVYDEAADAGADLRAALAVAKRDNKRVILQWGANWCGWCKLLDARMKSDPTLSRKLLYEYEIVHVDIGRFDKNMDLAEKLGATLRDSGVPFLTVLDADGKPIANQETGGLEKEQDGKPGHNPAAVLAFLERNQAPARPAAPRLDGALAAAKASGRRVFLSFGAPWCGWCHKLEDTLARPEVAKPFGKDFVVIKLDVDREPGAKELLQRYRGPVEGGIPWFAFLAADGELLAHSGSGGENLGCPYREDEVARFGDLLETAARHMSAADRAAVLAAFTANRVPVKKAVSAEEASS